MSKEAEVNVVLAKIYEILAKAKKQNKTIDIEEFNNYIANIANYSNNPKFDIRKKVVKTLNDWYKHPNHNFGDIKGISEALDNLNNNKIANNTDTQLFGTDKGHTGYRHFHSNGNSKCEFSVIYYKNPKSGRIHIVSIDSHKEMSSNTNKHPNIHTLD